MNKSIKLTIAIVCILFIQNSFADIKCNQAVNTKKNNFMIGYGSLMENQSRQRTNPEATNVYPIEVKGFKRTWGKSNANYKTNFLTLVKNANASLNAVYYPIDAKSIKNTDTRENSYCRILVPKKDLTSLGLNHLPDGDYWVYAQKDNKLDLPSKKYPIPQSYVDIFLNGCIQIENTFEAKGFLNKCITETAGWPKAEEKAWINDRLYPRRPAGVPNFFQIDSLLSTNFKGYYDHPFDSYK